MKKQFLIIALFIMTIVSISSCGSSKKIDTGKINVVSTIYPYTSLVELIGGDKVNATTIVGNGVDPHDYQPNVSVLKDLDNADLIINNGLGIDSWFDSMSKNLKDKSKIIDVNKGINTISLGGGAYDPHVWLGISETRIIIKNIKDQLELKDPKNKLYYEKNYKALDSQLLNLHNEYVNKFSKLSQKYFVTGHAAFAYFCRDFGLEQKNVEGVFEEGEVTTMSMAQLVAFCKKENIKTIFMESLASPEVSKTLANECGASVKEIYTMENQVKNMGYIDILKYDLNAVYNSFTSEN